MLDQYGRKIDYLRVSITDRCNLRCRYCMPDGAAFESHEAILRYEEILRICRAATELGLTRWPSRSVRRSAGAAASWWRR